MRDRHADERISKLCVRWTAVPGVTQRLPGSGTCVTIGTGCIELAHAYKPRLWRPRQIQPYEQKYNGEFVREAGSRAAAGELAGFDGADLSLR